MLKKVLFESCSSLLRPILSKVNSHQLKWKRKQGFLLLFCFGYLKSVPESNEKGEVPLSMAAQYDGPDFTKEEKVDLEKVFRLILEKRKQKK